MRKQNYTYLFFITFSCLGLLACTDTGKERHVDPGPVSTPVENVNGNIPDTNNSINLEQSGDTTTVRDSM